MKYLPITAALLCLTAGTALAQDRAMSRLATVFDEVDTDGNNAISHAEFLSFRAAQWSRLDRNGDGVLSQKDFPRFGTARANGRFAGVAVFDTNADGVVSEAEFVNGPTPAFDQADTDGNGVLTRNEVEAAARNARG